MGYRAKLLIGGCWVAGVDTVPVTDKFSGEVIGEADRATRHQVAGAIEAARRSFLDTRLTPHDRFRMLRSTSQLIEQRGRELAELITAESGIPITDALNEATRAAQTFLIAAEESKRLRGEMVPIEGAPGQSHRMAFTIRVPRGVVCGITSFNSPLNMVAHKVAPALASGNTVVIKPAQTTPLSAAKLCELLLEAGVPPAHVNLVQGPGREVGGWLVEHPEIAFFTFTGSTAVGRQLRRDVGLRPISLELGSVAATIIFDDADLSRAAPRCASSAFRRAGQMCTSTQRLFVQQQVYDVFLDQLAEATRALPVGDPRNPATVVGPMISEDEAARAERWIQEAVAAGARVVEGGRRSGSVLQPTILADVRTDMRVMCEEVFAPVVCVIPFHTLDEVVAEINAMPFGLAAGVFTRDIMRAMDASRRLHVGVVHINEPSSSRVDLMPFAGVKDSGTGREGPKYAMHEMTEERLVTMSLS